MTVPPNLGSALADDDRGKRRAKWRFDARLAATVRQFFRLRPNTASAEDMTASLADLARAIAGEELRLVYQPKLHLRGRHIGGVEALVRWDHPERGLIMPGDFVPAAEQTGAIRLLTDWVLDRAICDQRRIAEREYDLSVFINIAGALLTDEGFIAAACDRIRGSGAAIGLEITETSVIREPMVAIANLRHVADLGIPIAIDDYGAGLSSLAYLKQLPACELKIDKLFITQLTSSHRDPLIVRSTIDLAHAMEMEVVAEGVESETALALLSVMGCDMAQGYHISRPLELEDLVDFLAYHREGWVSEEGGSLAQLTSALRRA